MLTIITQFPYILLYGIFQIFFSAPGQTFLIALFVAPIFQEMGVSQSVFAGIYSAATLSASLFLNPAGRLIDRYYMHHIVIWISILMAAGCWILAGAQNLTVLFIGFFILRWIGQGVFGLSASTLIIKQFHKNRGKAIGIITLGFPLSEAIYPTIALLLLNHFGWRTTYVIFGFSNLILMLPFLRFLLFQAKIDHGEFLPGETAINPQRLPGGTGHLEVHARREFTLSETMRDIKFYLLLLASCLPPMIVTGLFFHQTTLFAANQWSITYAASGLMAYAFVKAVCSVSIGPVIDRRGPLLPFVMLITMLGTGTILAALGGDVWRIYLYYVVIGGALGFSSPVSNVVWPYFYGTKHMGSIKGIIATFRNGLTALGPLPVAIGLDAGVSITQILFWTGLGILCLASLPVIAFWIDKFEHQRLT